MLLPITPDQKYLQFQDTMLAVSQHHPSGSVTDKELNQQPTAHAHNTFLHVFDVPAHSASMPVIEMTARVAYPIKSLPP